MSKTCEFCNQREATALCTVCDQIFCDECQAGYKRVKFTANHQFVALDSSEKILSEESIGKGDTTLGVVHRPHSFVVNAGNLVVQNILTVDVRRGFSPLVRERERERERERSEREIRERDQRGICLTT